MSAWKGLVVATVVALLGTVMPAAGATLLVNGSFEAGVPLNTRGMTNGATFGAMSGNSGPNWDMWNNLNGWTKASGSGIAVMTDRSSNKMDAKNGEYYVGLDVLNNTRMTQSVALNTGTYTLSLWYNFDQGSAATNSMTFGVTGITGANTTYVPLTSTRQNWTRVSMNFRVQTVGIYQVYVGGVGSSDGKGGFIDDFELTQVPVPAAGLGLIGALAALGGLKRRRRA